MLMHLDVCSASKGWAALESFQFHSVLKFAGLGKGGRWAGKKRGGEKEHTLCNSILIIHLCTCIYVLHVHTYTCIHVGESNAN